MSPHSFSCTKKFSTFVIFLHAFSGTKDFMISFIFHTDSKENSDILDDEYDVEHMDQSLYILRIFT